MRIRLSAPRGVYTSVRYLDSLHGALVNAWTACGARATDVVGRGAANWSFGAVGSATATGFVLKSLVVGAEGGVLETLLPKLAPEAIRKSSSNGDTVDLSFWYRSEDALPVVCRPGETGTLGAIMLSPLAVSVRGRRGRWHDDLRKAGPDLEEAINFRLSRLTGREVSLKIEPDSLYLRANPKHSHAGPHTCRPRRQARIRHRDDVPTVDQRLGRRSTLGLGARDRREEPLRLRLYRARGEAFMSFQSQDFAHQKARDVYGAFLDECVVAYVTKDRVGQPPKSSASKIDGRPVRLVTISGKGGWSKDPILAERWAKNDNISLLDHLLSVARGALMFCLADATRPWSSEADLAEMERMAHAVVCIAFLHDIDKDLELPRGEEITVAARGRTDGPLWNRRVSAETRNPHLTRRDAQLRRGGRGHAGGAKPRGT